MWHSLGPTLGPLSTRPFSDKKDAPDPQFVASDKPRAEWVQPTGRGEGTLSLVGDVWARIWGTGKISEAVTPAPGPLRHTGDGWELRSARAHTPQHLHVPLPTHACEKGFHQITKCAHPFPLGPQCITHGIRRYHGGIPTSRRDQTDRLAAGRPGLHSELLGQMTECWCLVRCNVVELLSKSCGGRGTAGVRQAIWYGPGLQKTIVTSPGAINCEGRGVQVPRLGGRGGAASCRIAWDLPTRELDPRSRRTSLLGATRCHARGRRLGRLQYLLGPATANLSRSLQRPSMRRRYLSTLSTLVDLCPPSFLSVQSTTFTSTRAPELFFCPVSPCCMPIHLLSVPDLAFAFPRLQHSSSPPQTLPT